MAAAEWQRVLDAATNAVAVAERSAAVPTERRPVPLLPVRPATDAEVRVYKASLDKASLLRAGPKKRKLADIFGDVERDASTYHLTDIADALRNLKARSSGLSFAMRSLNRKLQACRENSPTKVKARLEAQAQTTIGEREAQLQQLRQELASLEQQRKRLRAKRTATAASYEAAATESENTKAQRSRLEAHQTQVEELRAAIAASNKQLQDVMAVLSTAREAGDAATTPRNPKAEAKRKELAARVAELEAALVSDDQGGAGKDPEGLARRRQFDELEASCEAEAKRCSQGHKSATACRTAARRLIQVGVQRGSLPAVALSLLDDAGGQLTLEDLKAKMASTTSNSGSKVLQAVYGLVGHRLLKLDRAHAETAAVSLLG